MSSISNLLTDYKNDNLSNLIYDNSNYTNTYSSNTKYKRLYVYNGNINNQLQKIWIRAPKMKVVKPTITLNNKLNQNVKLTMLLPSNDFSKFIKRLERKILMHIRNLTQKQIKIKSIIKESDDFPTTININMPFNKINNCVEFGFNIYNEMNKRVNIQQIGSNSYVSSIIELSEIWIGETNFGFNWNVLQLKLYPVFDFTKCLFIDDDGDPIVNNNDNNNASNNECYHCSYCPNANMRTHYCINNKNDTNVTSNDNSLLFLQLLTQMHQMVQTNKMQTFDISSLSLPSLPASSVSIPLPPPLLVTKQIKQLQNKPFVPSINELMSVKLKPINKDNKKEIIENKSLIDLISIKDNLKKVSIDNNKQTKMNIMDKKTLKHLSKMIGKMITEMEYVHNEHNEHNEQIKTIDEYYKEL